MNRPNRPEQPSLVTTVYLDACFEKSCQEMDARFEKSRQDLDAHFEKFRQEMGARFEQFAQRIELRSTRFEKRLAWKILGTLAGTILAMTAIFSAVVLIVGIDSGGN